VSEFLDLPDAIARHVRDGQTVALEGFTHLIPFAAGQEIIRQERAGLTVARMTPDLVYDQLIGAGCVDTMIFSWGGNPGVGSLHRMRDAIQHGWPTPLSLEEHSHAEMAERWRAGAAGLPFGVLRGSAGTSLARYSDTIRTVECPFTGERLTAVPALGPDVGIVHAQQADHAGNVHLWGISGVQKECVLASRTAIVTVEEVVDEFEPHVNSVVLPSWVIDAVCVVPGGAHPSYAHGFSERDNPYYEAWDEISRDRDRFAAWIVDLKAGRVGAGVGS
jgi:glutaconate CoA-transferase subunit A